MSTLIWSDVHNRIGVLEQFLERNGNDYQERYFLGDFFDNWNDNAEDARRTARYVKKLVNDPRNHLILGNHDIDYMFPHIKDLYCPGFEYLKNKAINEELGRDDWNKMKLAYFVDGWLLSHAGVHPSFVIEQPGEGITVDGILKRCDETMGKLFDGIMDRLVLWGSDRSNGSRAPQPVGGITWLDWGKFLPIENVNQIVGHTILDLPCVKYMDEKDTCHHRKINTWGKVQDSDTKFKSVNWCLDTDNRHFGVIEEGEMQVYRTQDFLY